MAWYRVWLETGIAGARQEDEIEIDDDATPEEVEETCKDEAFRNIDWGYEKMAKND